MAKRFTDTEKWNDPWYRKLPAAYKNFWDYICARCDNAGVWKVDMEMAQFQVDRTVDSAEALALLGDRVSVLNQEYWHIVGFVSFQFGELSEESKPHKSILQLIQKHQIKGYPKGIHTLKDKDKDIGKEKDNTLDLRKEQRIFSKPTLSEVEQFSKEFGLGLDSDKFFNFYESKGWMVGRGKMKDWKAAARLAAKDWAKASENKTSVLDFH